MSTQFKVLSVESVHGTNKSLYLLQQDGQTVSSITKPFNAYGIRRVPPSAEEALKIESENDRRRTLLDSFLTKWETSGEIDRELKAQLAEISP